MRPLLSTPQSSPPPCPDSQQVATVRVNTTSLMEVQPLFNRINTYNRLYFATIMCNLTPKYVVETPWRGILYDAATIMVGTQSFLGLCELYYAAIRTLIFPRGQCNPFYGTSCFLYYRKTLLWALFRYSLGRDRLYKNPMNNTRMSSERLIPILNISYLNISLVKNIYEFNIHREVTDIVIHNTPN